MFKRFKTDTLNWIIIIGVILLVIEIVFFHGGNLFNAVFAAIFAYIGWRNIHKLWGKIVFWIFLIGFILSVLNMMAVRFLIAAALVLFMIDYTKKNKGEGYLAPSLPGTENTQGRTIRLEPLFNHKWFEDQFTDETVYGWRDVNIHSGFGDKVIDLSNTVIPKDTAVISIRHVMGKIEIYVPYDVEVSIHHSSIFGRAHIFEAHHWKLVNKSLLYQTENYDTEQTRVKIITSILSGDIEVKRI
ncbi:hypothetical protein D8M04_04925 [Oceanobacillus piezotolerans]|uniref:Cell wall-active antibiotics response LiaF-like C-terminal domain-containing protein n=1 Tax=Oceanobacillus piezotolerans TaxID=2448030 RepID=A0A498D9Z2_9BACI|nr:cell wall-active antibiotics response protein LiaF [Oceanobacillus piezotolerans]RLL46554.1 hypothetical protein D8M04_04925 [Oceanobacillus piezotolerans]